MIKQVFILTLISLISINSNGQEVVTPIEVKPDVEFENIWSHKFFSDSLATSVLIWIKKEVKFHKHEFHTEHVYILEGSADMTIGGDIFSVVKGDLVVIPKNIPHSLVVTSRDPVKVISLQSPEFLGQDRVYIEKTSQNP